MYIVSGPYSLVYPPASSKRNHQEIIGLTEVYLRRWCLLRGLDIKRTPCGLLNHMFSVRADGLFGMIDADHQSSYLSGLLIGSEIVELGGHFWNSDEPVLLVGTTVLARIYGTAFDYLTIPY